LGPFEIFQRDDQYPIDYILDGQQRVTSIFGVFQTDIKLSSDENPFQIYFDYKASNSVQDSQFFALAQSEMDENRHFPINCLFDPISYRKETDKLNKEDIVKIDELQSKFKEVKIPFQTLETNDKDKVAIVFERINRKGIPLDTYQLLSAWTWSEDFALQAKFNDLADDLKPYGFEDVGSNINLLLRIGSAILTKDSSAGALINLNGASVKDRFDEIVNGVKGAIDFLKKNLRVEKIENLPYENILIPLSVFFSNTGNQHYQYTDAQRSVIEKWFWRTCFSRRYSAGTLKAINKDIEEIEKLKQNEPSNLASFSVTISTDYFTKNIFTMNTVNTKTFILMLAQNAPRSFISGANVGLAAVLKEYNRNEFHHIYPKAYLNGKRINSNDSCLANFCFLSRVDNQRIGALAPPQYRKLMPENVEEILSSHYISESLFVADDFNNFISDRAKKLLSAVNELIN
jgi:hypothetical protein